MSQPDDLALARLAERIELPRADFERLYDEVRGGRSLAFMVAALMSPEELPFLEPLKFARDDGWLGELATRLTIAGAFSGAVGQTAADKKLNAQLQNMIDPSIGMVKTEHLNQGTINAIKRVCRITIDLDKPVHGTGFLVGPQAVVTARHLVEGLIEEADKEKQGSHKQIKVHFGEVGSTFESASIGVMEQWLIASSPAHESELPDTPPAENDTLDPEEFRDRLDFAVLRLERTTGRERGYYRLDPAREPCVEEVNCGISLYQHPGGGSMHTAHGASLALWPDAIKTRLRHSANSIPGSSGGLIVDKSYEPVAMHQCGFVDADGNPVVNGAIPTARIAACCGKVEDIVGVDPIWRIAATGAPVIGRDNFQISVDRALTGTIRVISVRGAADSGKSFSFDILRGMLDEASHCIVKVSATNVPLEAQRFAEYVLAQIGDAADNDALPDVDEADTALEAWLRDHLLPALLMAMRRAAGNRILWLVIDDLDNHPMGEGTANSLLERLYAEIRNHSFLRIVLIGQRSAPRGLAPNLFAIDDVTEIGVAEVADYLAREYVHSSVSKPMEVIRDEANVLVNLAKTLSTDIWPEAISRTALASKTQSAAA